MTTLRLRLLTATLVAVIGILTTDAATIAEDPYTIDVIVPLTGPGAFLGGSEAKTLGVVEKAVNGSGGIKGRPIHFAIHDDQTSPQVAVQLANQIIENHPAAFLGPALTATCRAVEPLLKQSVVSYCFSPGVNPESGAYMFSAGLGAAPQTAGFVKFTRSKHYTRVGWIGATDATGQSGHDTIVQVFAKPENKDLTLTAEFFNINDTNVAAQMAHFKQAGIQVLEVGTSGSQIATVLRGALDSGLTVPIVTAGSNITRAQLSQYDTFYPAGLYYSAESVFAGEYLPRGPHRSAVVAFGKAMTADGLSVEAGSAYSWDPAMILIAALRRYGTSDTATQIRDFFGALRNYPGIDGTYDFVKNPQRGIDESDILIVHWDSKLQKMVLP